MERGTLIAIGLFAAGCASAPRAVDAPRTRADGPGSDRALPMPADLAPRIEESIALGRTIYFVDKASAIGTDVLREKVPDRNERRLGGWLTMRDADTSGIDSVFWVLFFTQDSPPRLAFRIRVPVRGEPTLEEVSPPTLLDDALTRLVRARAAAIAAVPRGARRINPVILPGSAFGRPDSLVVYLLAAEQKAGEMVFGIHYRVLVSADGSTVKQVIPLSKSAIVIPPAEEGQLAGAKRVAIVVSQIVTDWPLETHVFVSMLHGGTPVNVVTRRGTWLVVGDRITLVDDKPAR
jgi:hypothetical protein